MSCNCFSVVSLLWTKNGCTFSPTRLGLTNINFTMHYQLRITKQRRLFFQSGESWRLFFFGPSRNNLNRLYWKILKLSGPLENIVESKTSTCGYEIGVPPTSSTSNSGNEGLFCGNGPILLSGRVHQIRAALNGLCPSEEIKLKMNFSFM